MEVSSIGFAVKTLELPASYLNKIVSRANNNESTCVQWNYRHSFSISKAEVTRVIVLMTSARDLAVN